MIHELTRSFLADNSQTGICLCPWLAFRISCSPLAGRPSINSSRSISRSSNTSLVGSVGRRADLHRVWTRGRSTLPWNKRCSDEQAQRIFLPSDSVVSVIRSSPDKSTSLPARCCVDWWWRWRRNVSFSKVHKFAFENARCYFKDVTLTSVSQDQDFSTLPFTPQVYKAFSTPDLPDVDLWSVFCWSKYDTIQLFFNLRQTPLALFVLSKKMVKSNTYRPAADHSTGPLARATSKLTSTRTSKLTMTHTTAHTALHQRFQRSSGSGQRKEKSRFSASIPDAFRWI